ncbi:minor tail protein [Mycobacterium phage Sheen]|uniref:Minor tail protein n=1 Tax=Mycobacterium phage Sheen TaxID=1589274 RepID=A0A0B5A438_9CAUD|nr:minor tail protein with lysin activity [Mycobacterium phage Sheen]AJD82425.1 minor tail protein [Mycobacterium phage Sheen]
MALSLGTKLPRLIQWGDDKVIRKISLGSDVIWTAADPDLAQGLRDQLDTMCVTLRSTFGLSGVMFKLTGPVGKYEAAFGSTAGRALALNDNFRAGSITKMFTGQAALQQIAAGNIEYDATIDTYVSGYPNGDKITIENIMTMTSGLYNEQSNMSFMLNFVLNPMTPWSDDATLNLVKSNGVYFQPGKGYKYANSNYILLGRILETVTGRTISDILINDVVKKAGLNNTTWPTAGGVGPGGIPTPAANGYGPNPLAGIPILGWFLPAVTDQTVMNPEIMGCAGRLTSTLDDLLTFGAAVRDGTLITPEMHEFLLDTDNCWPSATGAPSPAPTQFGHGPGIISFGQWWGHPGGLNGYGCVSFWHPESGAQLVAMQNYSGLQVETHLLPQVAELLYPGSMAQPTYTKSYT